MTSILPYKADVKRRDFTEVLSNKRLVECIKGEDI